MNTFRSSLNLGENVRKALLTLAAILIVLVIFAVASKALPYLILLVRMVGATIIAGLVALYLAALQLVALLTGRPMVIELERFASVLVQLGEAFPILQPFVPLDAPSLAGFMSIAVFFWLMMLITRVTTKLLNLK